MIASEARNFRFPSAQELGAAPGIGGEALSEGGAAVREAIARGYAEGMAQGRQAAELEARSLADKARREGFEAGRGQAFARIEDAAAALRAARAEFERERAAIPAQAESFCVDLILAIVSRLAESRPLRAEFVTDLVRKALVVLAPEPATAVYLNPDDRALVGATLDGLVLKDDSTLAPGCARVEAGRLVVENGIDQALGLIKSALLEVSERRAGGEVSR